MEEIAIAFFCEECLTFEIVECKKCFLSDFLFASQLKELSPPVCLDMKLDFIYLLKVFKGEKRSVVLFKCFRKRLPVRQVVGVVYLELMSVCHKIKNACIALFLKGMIHISQRYLTGNGP